MSPRLPFFPQEPSKIKQRIRNYERSLKKEKKEFGDYHDGYGKRYLIGPLYMLANDLQGALDHFNWYEKTFHDDSGHYWQYLCWALACLRNKDYKVATQKFYRIVFIHYYFLPVFLNEEIEMPIEDEFDEYQKSEAYDTPPELIDLWQENEIEWAKKVYNHPEIKGNRLKYIELKNIIKKLPIGDKRNRLLEQQSSIRDTTDLPEINL